ncbi:hypothetical protein ACFL2F_04340 [Myxococcota bacterium]
MASGRSEKNCEDFCNDTYGYDAYSKGCDDQAAEPCQCEYDIIDGDIGECTPGDIECVDEWTLATCDDNGWHWTRQNCNDYCREQFGEYSHSFGCSAEAENPCMCDIAEGMMPVCSPGEMQCQDTETVLVCPEDMWSWTEMDCDTWCTETFGEDYYATECDDTNEDNICGCEYGMIDGGIGNPGP